MLKLHFKKVLKAQLGKPYVWGANGPKSFDCSGLYYWISNQLGFKRADTTAAGLYSSTKERVGAPQTGDLVFLHSSGYVSHVGIMYDSKTVIEARGRAWGVVKTKLSDFKRRGGYTYKGVRYDPKLKLKTLTGARIDIINAMDIDGKKAHALACELGKQSAPVSADAMTTLVSAWGYWNGGGLKSLASLADEAGQKHAIVLLGSALNANGTITEKYRARIVAAAQLHILFGSDILVCGGNPKARITEAAAGRAELIKLGVKENAIMLEENSTNTMQNAKFAIASLLQSAYKRYTIVTDGSHIRRASILFMAERTRRLTGAIRTWGVWVSDDNNVWKKPIDETSHETIKAEVKAAMF